ncbi:MAG: STAS domain-containing protein, partial [Bacteroidota bacterium]
FFIQRMSEVTQVTPLTRDLKEENDEGSEGDVAIAIPAGIEVYEVFGSLFFGAVDQFTESLRSMTSKPRIFILETKNLLAIDASGLRALESLAEELTRQGTQFFISGIHKQPLFAIEQSGFLYKIGEEHVFGSLGEALEKARIAIEQAKLEKNRKKIE